MPRLLILGGTGEARRLADSLGRRRPDLTLLYSLAGRTRNARLPACPVRRGGFGGVDGLIRFLVAWRAGAVLDATHPFAVGISANATAACDRLGVPRVCLASPAWTAEPGDDWRLVADAAEAAAMLRAGGWRRPLLTVGQGLAPFAGLADRPVAVRLVEPAPLPGPAWRLIVARGPFTLAAEQTLLRAQRCDVLVSKAAGGAATRAKLTAARTLGLPVIMIRRPVAPPGPVVHSIDACLAWLACLAWPGERAGGCAGGGAAAILPDGRLTRARFRRTQEAGTEPGRGHHAETLP